MTAPFLQRSWKFREGAERPEHLTLLRETIATDSNLPVTVANRVADRGFRNVGILGLAYKGDLKVHVLSPTLCITKRLMERGINVKINDPYYSTEEIKKITGADSFEFPDELSQFECILVVAGHRLYQAISENKLKNCLTNCKLVIDNVEEAWKVFDWRSTGIEYFVAGDSDWLG
jgi:hypothetical protein